MTAGSRFKAYIEGLSDSWGDRLKGWMASWVDKGLSQLMDSKETDAIGQVRATLTKIREHPSTSAEVKASIDNILTPHSWIFLLIAIPLAIMMFIPMVTAVSQPLGNMLRYVQDRLLRTFRLDPNAALTAWRRDKTGYNWVFDDLRDQGVPERTIETLKEQSNIIPGTQDLIRMSVREAFSPEIAEKFGQYQDPPTAVYPWAEKLGLSKEWVDRYWAAHWELPGANQGFELLHRGIITEDELKLLLRALDVMPFWRDKLIKLSWNVPTRVDTRRFWDLRTIDEKRLREIYTGLGYHAQDLEDYILWTKIYVEFPDLLARFKNGWVSLDDVRRRLLALGMDAAAAEELLQTKVQAEGAARSNAERDLTLTDIYKGVKMERITRAEAVGLIMDLGYSEDEAGFKLDVNVPTDETTSAVEQRQLAKADVLSGLKAGIITREGARQMLLQLRYAAVDVEFLLKLYDAQIKPPTEVKLLEASKADIVLGVKKGLITQSEGHAMLLDLGYAPAAADFILTVQTTESPFSPVNFDEFKDRTQKWRLAAGMEGKPMTEEIKKLGADVVRLSAEVAALEKAIKAEQGKLVPDTVIPAEATARVRELQAVLYKAQAELARVRTDYNAKVAEWKHAAK
jgi:alkylhydroperoxidase/carboxymuconolactone decarboxylase family protein YurZ